MNWSNSWPIIMLLSSYQHVKLLASNARPWFAILFRCRFNLVDSLWQDVFDPLDHFGGVKLRFSFLLFAVALFATNAVAAPITGQGTWEAELQSRDLNGDGVPDAYYSSHLNLTWLKDSNIAATLGVGQQLYPEYNPTGPSGFMTWDEAITWSSSVQVYGKSNWRLPKLTDPYGVCYGGGPRNIACDRWATTPENASEIAYLYYKVLGNTLFSINMPFNTGPFDLTKSQFWLANEDVSLPNESAWIFEMYAGVHSSRDYKGNLRMAWLVHEGDIGTSIPEPITLVLVIIGLTAIALVRSQRNIKNR